MSIKLNKKDTTFEQLINIFLTSSKAKGLSEKTLQTYSSHLHLLASYLGQGVLELYKRIFKAGGSQ